MNGAGKGCWKYDKGGDGGEGEGGEKEKRERLTFFDSLLMEITQALYQAAH